MITIDEFKKLEIRIGKILSAEKVPETDKLLRLSVDFGLKPSPDGSPDLQNVDIGDRDIRQIVSGIAGYFPDLEKLIGKKCAFAYNLEPRTIKGLESQGMILAVSGNNGEQDFFSLLETGVDVSPGSTVK